MGGDVVVRHEARIERERHVAHLPGTQGDAVEADEPAGEPLTLEVDLRCVDTVAAPLSRTSKSMVSAPSRRATTMLPTENEV